MESGKCGRFEHIKSTRRMATFIIQHFEMAKLALQAVALSTLNNERIF